MRTTDYGVLVCRASRHAAIDWQSVCVDVSVGGADSPIDIYFDNVSQVTSVAFLPDVQENFHALRILLLGAISAAEHYFRSVLAGLINFCGASRRVAAQQTLRLGALDYYSNTDVGFALFEHDSFTSRDNIRESTKRVIRGVQFGEGTDVWVSLDEFEKLCQLRHASVHAWGRLGTTNLQKMGLFFERPVAVGVPDQAKFQEMILACHNAVRSYNSCIFNHLVNVWVEDSVISGSWQSDHERFSKLFFHFYSFRDTARSADPSSAYQEIVSQI